MYKTVKKSGFTIIEILVAITIFSMVMLITNGIFTTFITSQRRDISEQKLQEEIRLAMEFLSKELRTSFASSLTSGATGQQIFFRDHHCDCVTHRIQDGEWQHAQADIPISIECDNESANYPSFTPITSRSTIVEELSLKMPTEVTEDNQLIRQGFTTVILQAKSANVSMPALSLQTTITSRQDGTHDQYCRE